MCKGADGSDLSRRGAELWLGPEHVKEQTEAICLAAVQQNGLYLLKVKIRTPEIVEAAKRQIIYA